MAWLDLTCRRNRSQRLMETLGSPENTAHNLAIDASIFLFPKH